MGKYRTAARHLPWPENLLTDISDGRLGPIGPGGGKDFGDFDASLAYVLKLLETRRNRNQHDFLLAHYKDGLAYARIGESAGLTAERVRQIVAMALAYLRHPDRLRYLKKGVAAVVHDSGNNGYHRGLAKGRSESALNARTAYAKGLADADVSGKTPADVVDGIAPVIQLLSTGVDGLPFKVRTRNVLYRARVKTLGQLVSMSDRNLAAIRDCGDVTIRDIRHVVADATAGTEIPEDLLAVYSAAHPVKHAT